MGHLLLLAGMRCPEAETEPHPGLGFQQVTCLGFKGLGSESKAAGGRGREALGRKMVGKPNIFQSTQGNRGGAPDIYLWQEALLPATLAPGSL